VLVTYDDNGFYGHPDHIKSNRITVAAFAAAADPNYQSAAGPAWQVGRLFYTAISLSRMREFGRRLRENGLDAPLDPDDGGEPSMGTPDHLVTTVLDVTAQVERKRQALLAHASQMGPEGFFAQIPAQLFAEMFGTEEFQLVQGEPGVAGLASDLFAGLR
jgi:LmbE family N-acetylglucosaminyl deacetylase